MKKVLLVNDSRFESMILKNLFNSLGYEVTVTDEYHAMRKVDDDCPELIVVNYIMENISGEQLVQTIKGRHPETQCLISSNSKLILRDFEAFGVDGILRTPVSDFTLKDLLRRLAEVKMAPVSDDRETARACDHCKADISGFSRHILYCPFCGEEIND